ncbi:hypothetical protein GEMRC1_008479 [Eukaryota sp. GEM-RC1]
MPVIKDPFRRTVSYIASFLSLASQLLLQHSTVFSPVVLSLELPIYEKHGSLLSDTDSHVSRSNITIPGSLTKDYHITYSYLSNGNTIPLVLFSFSFSPTSLVYSDSNVSKSDRSYCISSYSRLTTLLRSIPFLFNTLPISSLPPHVFNNFIISTDFPTNLPSILPLSNLSNFKIPSPQSHVSTVSTLVGTVTLTMSYCQSLPSQVSSSTFTNVVCDSYLASGSSPISLDTSVPPRRSSLSCSLSSKRGSFSFSLNTPRARSGSNVSTMSDVFYREPPDLLFDMKVRVFPAVDGQCSPLPQELKFFYTFEDSLFSPLIDIGSSLDSMFSPCSPEKTVTETELEVEEFVEEKVHVKPLTRFLDSLVEQFSLSVEVLSSESRNGILDSLSRLSL